MTGLAAKGDVTFAALRGGRISACKRVRLQGTVQAHQGDVVGMLVLGDVLVTAGSDGVLRVWETSGDLAGWSDAEVRLSVATDRAIASAPLPSAQR